MPGIPFSLKPGGFHGILIPGRAPLNNNYQCPLPEKSQWELDAN